MKYGVFTSLDLEIAQTRYCSGDEYIYMRNDRKSEYFTCK
jgi:hypothetical protein